MMMRRQQRRGAALVEAAIVYPVLFVLILGIVMVGIAVFRYQQVAHAAREGARWAAVHGYTYGQEGASATPTRTAATAADIFTNAIQPQIAGMQASGVTYSVSWTTGTSTSNKRTHNYVYTDPSTGQSSVREQANTVSVTVSYSWNTGLFGVIPVSSTYVMPMSY
jgi:Flp pilus assembly protein TadG